MKSNMIPRPNNNSTQKTTTTGWLPSEHHRCHSCGLTFAFLLALTPWRGGVGGVEVGVGGGGGGGRVWVGRGWGGEEGRVIVTLGKIRCRRQASSCDIL